MSKPVTRIEYHIISPRYDKDGSVIPYQPGEPVEAEEIIVEDLTAVLGK